MDTIKRLLFRLLARQHGADRTITLVLRGSKSLGLFVITAPIGALARHWRSRQDRLTDNTGDEIALPTYAPLDGTLSHLSTDGILNTARDRRRNVPSFRGDSHEHSSILDRNSV